MLSRQEKEYGLLELLGLKRIIRSRFYLNCRTAYLGMQFMDFLFFFRIMPEVVQKLLIAQNTEDHKINAEEFVSRDGCRKHA